MQKNFRITVDGRSYHVVVEDLDVGTSPAFVRPAPAVAAAPVIPAPVMAVPVAVAAPAAPAPAAPPAAGPGSVVAPLGGVVFSIDVPLGHTVAVGDRVATIEAMKMKTEVMSKLAGNVSHIAAKANDSVETGQVLMTIG
ncbi:MAG: biotin/lipoyl-containing protein [Acetobacteraceae bacterium]|jgi:biotin carboxyl carrier protein